MTVRIFHHSQRCWWGGEGAGTRLSGDYRRAYKGLIRGLDGAYKPLYCQRFLAGILNPDPTGYFERATSWLWLVHAMIVSERDMSMENRLNHLEIPDDTTAARAVFNEIMRRFRIV